MIISVIEQIPQYIMSYSVVHKNVMILDYRIIGNNVEVSFYNMPIGDFMLCDIYIELYMYSVHVCISLFYVLDL